MTNDQALKLVKDLLEYSKSNTVSEIKTDEYDAPLLGANMSTKKITKVEYFIRTVETVVSSEYIDKQIQNIDSQLATLANQKDDLVGLSSIVKKEESTTIE